jgi:hypothetical protein
MISDSTPSSVTVPAFPDRLALTASDRRLELRVLIHLVRSGNGTRRRGAVPAPPTQWPGPIDNPSRPDEAWICHQAMRLAEFLCREFRAFAREQQRIVAELAVEVAQRLAEELPSPEQGSRVG